MFVGKATIFSDLANCCDPMETWCVTEWCISGSRVSSFCGCDISRQRIWNWIRWPSVRVHCAHTSIQSIFNELSGPRPLHRVVDIVSKPRTWNRNATAVSFENQPTPQITGDGKDFDSTCFNPTECWPASTPDASVSSVYAMRKASDING